MPSPAAARVYAVLWQARPIPGHGCWAGLTLSDARRSPFACLASSLPACSAPVPLQSQLLVLKLWRYTGFPPGGISRLGPQTLPARTLPAQRCCLSRRQPLSASRRAGHPADPRALTAEARVSDREKSGPHQSAGVATQCTPRVPSREAERLRCASATVPTTPTYWTRVIGLRRQFCARLSAAHPICARLPWAPAPVPSCWKRLFACGPKFLPALLVSHPLKAAFEPRGLASMFNHTPLSFLSSKEVRFDKSSCCRCLFRVPPPPPPPPHPC